MRTRANILTAIWDDPDFLALPPLAQRMYFFVLSQKKLTLAGALDVNLDRWAKKSAGLTAGEVEQGLDELEQARFVLIDRGEGELVVRTLVKNDPVRSWQAVKGMWSAWEMVASERLRHALVFEMPDRMWTTTEAPAPVEAITLRQMPLGPYASPIEAPAPVTYREACAGAPPLIPSPLDPPPTLPAAQGPRDGSEPVVEQGGREDEIMKALVNWGFWKWQPRTESLKDKIRNDAKALRPQILEALQRWPKAPAEMIVGWLNGEDARNLSMYAVPLIEADDGPPADQVAAIRAARQQLQPKSATLDAEEAKALA